VLGAGVGATNFAKGVLSRTMKIYSPVFSEAIRLVKYVCVSLMVIVLVDIVFLYFLQTGLLQQPVLSAE